MKITSDFFTGKNVIYTGTFSNFSSEDLEFYIEKHGGVIKKSISRKLDVVIVGANAGPSKIVKVLSLKKKGVQITILSENDLDCFESN